jgi:cystathionine beta-lyase/cystathionine gamma-synthase
VIADISLAGLCNIDFDFSQYDCTTSSCTKYVSGNNDVLRGVLLTGSQQLYKELWTIRSERGGLMDPFLLLPAAA